MALLAGAVLLGLVAVIFAKAGEAAQVLFGQMVQRWPLMPLAWTPLAFVALAWTTRRWFPASAGSGIPQVMAASHAPHAQRRGPLISLSTAVAKFLGTLGMMLAGSSTGREGPTVQISAALMGAVHRWLKVPLGSGAIIAGGAAGVAAAFNTPLAGVAFAIEELASAFEQRLAAQVMAAVMIAGLVSLYVSGDYIYFGAVAEGLAVGPALVSALLAGVVGGLSGGLFSRAMQMAGSPRKEWIRRAKAHPLLFAGGCGLAVAMLGIGSRGASWGTGYEITKGLLGGHAIDGAVLGVPRALLFAPVKFLASLATAVCGAAGGIFAPSLSVGAGLGPWLQLLEPHANPGALALLGMIAYFTGVVRAPLTAIIIVMEMTESRAMLLPLFAAALIADRVSAAVCREKLYHALSRSFLARNLKTH